MTARPQNRAMTDAVRLYEVGPRDGLQNETRDIPVAEKIALIDLLSRSGLTHIEAGSFVSPKWVPQMAGSGAVLRGITRVPGVTYAALTPNLRGLEDALAVEANEVAIFASASEGFSQANLNAGIEEAMDRFAPVVAAARDAGVPVRGYVSCVVACPFDGHTEPSQVAAVVRDLFGLGCYEVSLGDTTGAGTPHSVTALLRSLLRDCDPDRLAGHFHDTGGQALDNIDAALGLGLRRFDTAVGGLGGCPYAPGAPGNVATERVLAHLDARGYATGLDADTIEEAARLARAMRGDRDVRHDHA